MRKTHRLEALLESGTDTAALRFALASAHFASGDLDRALEHARAAVDLDPDYSAAWRLLGKLQTEAEDLDAAAEAYRRGIAAASRRGDRQAEKEMTVFLRRLEKRGAS